MIHRNQNLMIKPEDHEFSITKCETLHGRFAYLSLLFNNVWSKVFFALIITLTMLMWKRQMCGNVKCVFSLT